MKVKMCGMRREEDIIYANEIRPDYVGFIFADSKRYISPEMAEKFRKGLNENIKVVGVFVNEDVKRMAEIAKKVPLDVIQLHGEERKEDILELKKLLGSEVQIWKAVRVRKREDVIKAMQLPAEKILLDSFAKNMYGGTGKLLDISLLTGMSFSKPYFLAGGLNTENIGDIIKKIHPYGIDLSGGIETDGKKDQKKMKKIMEIVGGYHG
jgi:phosphoribosylanthranilate isomerase